MRLANAVALSQLVLSVLCYVISYAAPDFSIRVARSFFHPLDSSALVPAEPRSFDIAQVILALVAWTVLVWVSVWLAGVFYNVMTGKERPRT